MPKPHLRGTKWYSPVVDKMSPLTHPPANAIPTRNPQATSLSTAGGCASLRARPSYTGHTMLGVATMHKSNAVPVFSESAAKDLAGMRR